MKYILSILLIGNIFVFSQDKNPNVELPDFVIFGKDIISVRNVEKIEPDFISIVTGEFLKPAYKPDYLVMADIFNPVEAKLSLFDSSDFRKGFLELKAGRYQLPAGQLNYTFPFSGGMVRGFIKGLNQLEYLDNSDNQYLEGSLDFAYTIPTDIQAMPGTKFSLSGDHKKNLFKFFGSVDPGRKRTLNIGNASFGIQNLYMKDFIFDLNGGGDFTYLDDEKFDEVLYYANGFFRMKLSSFSLGLKVNYQHQNLNTDLFSEIKTDAYLFRPTASLEIFDKIMMEAGFTFTRLGSDKLNGIFASFSAELARNFVLLAEYSPEGENITAGKFLRNNFYYDQKDLTGVFLKKKNKLKATVKYEFDKYYQIDGGMEYFGTDNLPYYNNSDTSGFFEVFTTDAKSWNIFLNLLYHPGPYGYLYGSVNYLNVQNSNSKKIPYSPFLKASLIYGYLFSEDWKGEVKFSYLSDRYADLENTYGRKLPSIFELGLKVTYSFEHNFGVFFELNNILNTKRAIWEGYQEKPFEALLGLNYFLN